MTRDDSQLFVNELYTALLERAPSEAEQVKWTNYLVDGHPPHALFRLFINSKEYGGRRAVKSVFSPGHFHSPVVDPSTVVKYHARSQAQGVDDLNGIRLSSAQMINFWERNLTFIRSTPFTNERDAARRFYYGGPFPWADAITLRAMIGEHRPRRVIEIGSGFSTACMLDTADECGLKDFSIICIEPDPTRLQSLLRADDYKRVQIIKSPVQDVPLDLFDKLEGGDFLFIDSTHVLKTGSDVHYELFGIMPRLKDGVIIQVHDCHFPFEYPKGWVFDLNYSWNEAYALRAFLMYNMRFSVLFWGSYLASAFRSRIKNEYPDFLRNTGGSIWLTVENVDGVEIERIQRVKDLA